MLLIYSDIYQTYDYIERQKYEICDLFIKAIFVREIIRDFIISFSDVFLVLLPNYCAFFKITLSIMRVFLVLIF